MRIRKAESGDAAQFIRIKHQLHLQLYDGVNHQGGFLLGTTEFMYNYFIDEALCLVAEKDACIVGFGIVLPDILIRSSPLWNKRNSVEWKIALSEYEDAKLAYVEQLAFLPKCRFSAVALAYTLLEQTFSRGVQAVFTTTVKKPVTNLAALPLIFAAGGIQAGNIDEYYSEYGNINSDIYLITADAFRKRMQAYAPMMRSYHKELSCKKGEIFLLKDPH